VAENKIQPSFAVNVVSSVSTVQMGVNANAVCYCATDRIQQPGRVSGCQATGLTNDQDYLYIDRVWT
jgi:hypothetical protein